MSLPDDELHLALSELYEKQLLDRSKPLLKDEAEKLNENLWFFIDKSNSEQEY